MFAHVIKYIIVETGKITISVQKSGWSHTSKDTEEIIHIKCRKDDEKKSIVIFLEKIIKT